ncbi:A disintegrin and metalloproteinase with thrombospondin motifs adt-1 isoform X2 [Lingula anatina]|uniref:A disintegrin and metalloproteinase with thrombospondin motifs adt-1 isoform X2 n=1 Tax=Lingula anatina TaxID=7574 RepID=A0A1S3K9J0_LINAN|nr:A disintegrin and metalloproteinase with thrombospondin motifs adt-1 isoform X2 [Lingula anatina]|eukprot:XP_013419109.1 A disintegrin and metalloproteinase with thrombospondin motifs adt-1 isoform X2 [Lingula anatina]
MERTFYVFLAFLVHSVASQGQIDVDLTDHGKKGIHGGDEGCTNTKLDLVFVLDESSSIWGPDFKAQLQFLSHITEDFRIGPDATQIAVLTFSNRATDHFYLNRYNTAEALQKAIVGIRQQGGGTYTNRALDRMRERYFLAANGGRPGVPKLGIIITDGASRDKALTAAAAAEARAQNITLVAIGVGANIGREELNLIASERKGKPGDKYTYTVENYEALDSIRVELSKVTCEEPAKWSPWTPYSTCSKTCGDGSQTRTRTCPKPGKCPGAAEQTRPCNLRPCRSKSNISKEQERVSVDYLQLSDTPVDTIRNKVLASWTAWSEWTECSVTCDTGQTTRSRDCRNGVPSTDCLGDSIEVGNCSKRLCETAWWTQWSQFGSCSATCGDGVRARRRDCHGGIAGINCTGPSWDEQKCNEKICAVWSGWGPYGSCSVTCGRGEALGTRKCIGGSSPQDCRGPDRRARPCKRQSCPEWTQWSHFSQCSVTCGNGERSRVRTCIGGEAGYSCRGDATEYIECNQRPCATWSQWGEYSSCSVSCGKGLKVRKRKCVYGRIGSDCRGEDRQQKSCQAGSCEIHAEDLRVGMGPLCPDGISSDGTCITPAVESNLSDQSPCNTQQCNIWGEWSSLRSCSVTCGNGTQSRTRVCEDIENNVQCSIRQTDVRSCNEGACPAWTAWTPYGACSVTCGSGTQVRSRRCEEGVPGVDCPGSERESRPCNLGSCRVPAAWTQWSGYGDCSVTCGTGVQSRSRTCERGVAGVDCPGSEVDSRECVLASCKAPAAWTEWGSFSACSVTCGTGSRMRARTCKGGRPGIDCPGKALETPICKIRDCSPAPPRKAQWTAWGRYGECSVTCGGGERSRSRSCITGVPGVDCPGPEKMTERCNEKPCPAWGPFGPFGKCSVDCGIGTYTRTRPCIGGVAGVDCPGSDSDTQPCDAGKCPTPVEDPCCEELDEGDIAFVSDSMNFGGVKGNKAVKFIEDVISDLPIEGGKVQAAVVSNKCLAKMGFFLNTYKDKAAMSEHLHNLPGDEVVQPMLETMRTSYFDPANGARAGARKIGVLVVDDDAKLTYKTMDEIMKAKQNNIELFVVAMSPNIDDFKMQFMADEPRQMHMYKMKDGSAPNIEEMRKQLRNNICTRLMRRKL